MHPARGKNVFLPHSIVSGSQWKLIVAQLCKGKIGERRHTQHFGVFHCKGKHGECLHRRRPCLVGMCSTGNVCTGAALAVLRCTVRLAQLSTARATSCCCVCVLWFVLCVCLCCGFLYFFSHGALFLFLSFQDCVFYSQSFGYFSNNGLFYICYYFRLYRFLEWIIILQQHLVCLHSADC